MKIPLYSEPHSDLRPSNTVDGVIKLPKLKSGERKDPSGDYGIALSLAYAANRKRAISHGYMGGQDRDQQARRNGRRAYIRSEAVLPYNAFARAWGEGVAGLADMEELIATVGDKEVAAFLREALSCYGANAHRACIVICNIALFDGLRRKLRVLAAVNKVAKSVSDEIEPLANAQKVFETPMIHRLKGAKIITELEAHILEQINSQRNKAAHPSGHIVTAEEARFVFSEVITKFLSQPLRETSYVVESIAGRLAEANFFPSYNFVDMIPIVNQELEHLDDAALPYLLHKIINAIGSADKIESSNARNFVLTLAVRRNERERDLITSRVVEAKSSDHKNDELIASILSCDPEIYRHVGVGTKLRVRNLLNGYVQRVGVEGAFGQAQNPLNVISSFLALLGEDYTIAEMGEFVSFAINSVPYSPGFVMALKDSPKLLSHLFDHYLRRASSSQWNESAAFASAVPTMDRALSAVLSEMQVFQLMTALVVGANWGGFGPQALTNTKFSNLPNLRQKATSFLSEQPHECGAIMQARGIEGSESDFGLKYLL